MLAFERILKLSECDENATVWKIGTLEEVRAYAATSMWRGAIFESSSGSYWFASVPVRYR